MTDPNDLWTRTEVAAHLGIAVDSVSRYRKIYPDFPEAVRGLYQPDAIRAWDANRPGRGKPRGSGPCPRAGQHGTAPCPVCGRRTNRAPAPKTVTVGLADGPLRGRVTVPVAQRFPPPLILVRGESYARLGTGAAPQYVHAPEALHVVPDDAAKVRPRAKGKDGRAWS